MHQPMFPMSGFGQEPPAASQMKTWPLVLGVVGVGAVLAVTLYLTRDKKPAPRMRSNTKRPKIKKRIASTVARKKRKPLPKKSTTETGPPLLPSAAKTRKRVTQKNRKAA